MQNRPSIEHTLNSLKSAMNAEEDQILDEDYGQNTEFVSSDFESEEKDISVAVKEIMPVEESNEEFHDEEVFSSEEEIVATIVKTENKIISKPFVLTRMIQKDGTVLNLESHIEEERPALSISEQKVDSIVREEAKSLIKDWLDRNMHKFLRKA